VLQRSGLAKTACECYAAVKTEFDRLLSDIPRGDPFVTLAHSGPKIDSPPAAVGQYRQANSLPSRR
jgi:hypothetical protein